MTDFERFKIEVEGLTETITRYSNSGKIGNYVKKLLEAVSKSDKHEIVYQKEIQYRMS